MQLRRVFRFGSVVGRRGSLVLVLVLWAPLVLGACQAPPASAPKAAAPAATTAPAAAKPAGGSPAAQPTAGAPVAAAPTQRPAPQAIKMTVPAKSLAFLPFYVGVEKGIYEAEGIVLEMPMMASNLAVASMTAGEINYTSSTASAIQAAISGSPFKVVSFMLKDLAFSIMAAPEIASPADLRGKAIAVTNLTAADDYAWRAVARAYGVSPDDVTAVATGTTANSLAALASGGVAAAVLSPPSDDQAERQGYRSLAWTADYLKRAQSGLATSDRRMQEAPDEVKRMIRATLRSVHHTLDNPADAIDVIVREYAVAPDLAPSTYQKIVRVMGRDGEVAEEAIREEIEDTKARTGVTADVPVSRVMDLTMLRQVRAEMGMR